MVKRIILWTLLGIFAGILTSGCQTVDKEVQIVKVPVLHCPEPPKVARPDLQIFELENSDKVDYQKVAKTYAASIKELQYHIEYLELQLDVFRRLK